MKVLIVEDDELKRVQIALAVKNYFKGVQIHFAKSMNSGMRSIVEEEYDLIILDMSMPTFDVDSDETGGSPQYYAGSEILYEMERSFIETPVIIVTQFDKFGERNNEMTLQELDEHLKSDGLNNYKGAIYYNSALDSWKHELNKMFQNLNYA